MSIAIPPIHIDEIVYPESDGQPMADNTKQFRWIVTIQGGLDALFQHDPNVFVAGDLLWYPVKGSPPIRRAPDVMVVFGRPKGDRGAYLQWVEDGIAPQVVFEVLSPGNTVFEMGRKLEFYDTYGVEEYYVYDPDFNRFSGWQRAGAKLQAIDPINGWVSPRLGIRFELTFDTLLIHRPDGKRFLTFVEQQEQADLARVAWEQAREQARQERLAREHAQQQAEQAQELAEHERIIREQAQQWAEQAQQQAKQAQQRAEQLAARLRTLGVDPDA